MELTIGQTIHTTVDKAQIYALIGDIKFADKLMQVAKYDEDGIGILTYKRVIYRLYWPR